MSDTTDHPQRILVTNGVIHTMDDDRPMASSMLIDGPTIVSLDPAINPHAPGVDVVDLHGRTVVPGFIDSHNHLSIAALYPRWLDLSDIQTAEELAAAIIEYASQEPETPWIRAANWVPEVHGSFDRQLLDSLGLDRPIMLAGASLHEGVVDSQGLDHLHISRHTADPPAGLIVRDSGGEPTGYLIETAWSAAHAASMAGYNDPQRWGDLIVQRATQFLRDGVTAIHDAACSPQAEEVYRQLARAGRLPLSVLSMPHPAAMLTDDLGDRLEGARTGEGDAWFRVGPVKLFADGGRHGASSSPDAPDQLATGIYFESIEQQIPYLIERGYRVAVHTVGDYAIRGCLEAFASVARQSDEDHRFRLEHVIKPRREQITQMRSLEVVASVQPGIITYYGDQVLARADPQQVEKFFPFRSFTEAGIRLAASSDDPCAPFGPLQTSLVGVTRRTPRGAVLGSGQAMELSEWIRAYTAGSAWAGGQEHERGKLAPGLRADFVVLDTDLNSSSPPRVAETWVAGRQGWVGNQPDHIS